MGKVLLTLLFHLFDGKLKFCCVVPSPHWTELLGFESHLWHRGSSRISSSFCCAGQSCWIMLLKWRFHKVQFHRRDNLTTKPELLGNLSKQSPQSNSDKASKDYRKMQLPYSPKIKCVDSGQTKIHCLSSRRSKHSVSIKEVSEEHVSTLPSQNLFDLLVLWKAWWFNFSFQFRIKSTSKSPELPFPLQFWISCSEIVKASTSSFCRWKDLAMGWVLQIWGPGLDIYTPLVSVKISLSNRWTNNLIRQACFLSTIS